MRKRLTAILLCAALAAALLAGCAAEEAPLPTPEREQAAQPEQPEQPSAEAREPAETPAASAKSVTDMLGNTVEIGEVSKIVSLTPAGTEIVYALGAGDLLVGVDAFSNYPEEAQSLEIVGDFNGPDVEKIVSLEPDVVLAGNTLQQDAIDQLKGLGQTFVCVEATTFDQIPDAIALIGATLGREVEAEALNGELQNAVKLAEDSAPAEKPVVYYAMSYGDMGNWTSGPGSFINTMIETAGGAPVVTDEKYPPWVELPVEELAAADPDMILIDASMGSAGDIADAPGYADLTAVKEGWVYPVNADIFTRPGPRVAEALRVLSDILNGKAENA